MFSCMLLVPGAYCTIIQQYQLVRSSVLHRYDVAMALLCQVLFALILDP